MNISLINNDKLIEELNNKLNSIDITLNDNIIKFELILDQILSV